LPTNDHACTAPGWQSNRSLLTWRLPANAAFEGGENVNQENKGIRVEIYDQSYYMRGDLDPDYIRKLAQFVDAKMRSIAARTRTVDSLRLAVLAALNMADECYQMRAKVEQVEQKMTECSGVLDELLEVN
jgi:cell division protein ZapA